MPDANLIGSSEACEILGGIDRSTLIRWIQLGKIEPAARIGEAQGAFVFHREAIEALRRTLAADAAEAAS